MQLHIYKNTGELVDELAKWITDYISQTLQKQNHFTPGRRQETKYT